MDKSLKMMEQFWLKLYSEISNIEKSYGKDKKSMKNSYVKRVQTRFKNKKAAQAKSSHSESLPKETQKPDKNTVPQFYIYAHNLGKYDGVFLLRSYFECEVSKFQPGRLKTHFKDGVLIQMSQKYYSL